MTGARRGIHSAAQVKSRGPQVEDTEARETRKGKTVFNKLLRSQALGGDGRNKAQTSSGAVDRVVTWSNNRDEKEARWQDTRRTPTNATHELEATSDGIKVIRGRKQKKGKRYRGPGNGKVTGEKRGYSRCGSSKIARISDGRWGGQHREGKKRISTRYCGPRYREVTDETGGRHRIDSSVVCRASE